MQVHTLNQLKHRVSFSMAYDCNWDASRRHSPSARALFASPRPSNNYNPSDQRRSSVVMSRVHICLSPRPSNNYYCSSGSSKIKGTASGIYPIPLRISGQYLYPIPLRISCPGSHAHFLGNIYVLQEVS